MARNRVRVATIHDETRTHGILALRAFDPCLDSGATIFDGKKLAKISKRVPKPDSETTPAALGLSMPAEWELHEATWLAWPHNPHDWPDKLDTIRWVYSEIVRKIVPGEIVRIFVNNKSEQRLARSYLSRAGADLKRVDFITHPTNRGWTRDTGPIFVRRKRGERSGSARRMSTKS